MNPDDYHIQVDHHGAIVYYYNPRYGYGYNHADSEILLTTTFVSLSTLDRLATEHYGRNNG